MKRNDNPYNKTFTTSSRAAKAAASGILLALLLAGCSQKNPVKTQPISSMESSSQTTDEASQKAAASAESSQAGVLPEETASLPAGQAETAASAAAQAASDQAGSLEADAESYYRAKAEQDAIHIDIAKLEADFRVGKLSKEDFIAQKSQLEAEKDALDREEDRLEDSLDLAYYQSNPSFPSGSLEELRSMESELEQKEHQLEAQEDALEQSYWAGEVTRDDFIAQQIELIWTEETMDREEELLEDALDAMGYDD